MDDILLNNDVSEEKNEEITPAPEKMAPQVYYADTAVIKNFRTLSEGKLNDLTDKVVPSLCFSSLKFIRENLGKKKESLNCGELRLLEKIVAKRRESADGILISDLSADSLAIRETYADLKKKATVLYGNRAAKELTLTQCANVSAGYMDYVGRADDGSIVVSEPSPKDGVISFTARKSAVAISFLEGKRKTKPEKLPKGEVCVALLLPDKDSGTGYFPALKKFFRSCGKSPVYESRVKIGEFGIVELACRNTKGMFVDLSRLVTEEISAKDALVDAYCGRYALFFMPENRQRLALLAKNASLRFVYFAKTAEDGVLRTGKKHPCVYSLPLSLMGSLIESHRVSSVSVGKSELDRPVNNGTVKVIAKGEEQTVVRGIVTDEKRIFAPRFIDSEGNSFADALNTTVNATLSLVAAGVNRRAICAAYDYEFPAEGVSDGELGEDLALILGAYRTDMELAIPSASVNVRFSEGRRALLYTPYALLPKRRPAERFIAEGNDLYFLPLGRSSDGMADYKELRRLCDKFFELCKGERVLSAAAVLGSLKDASEQMSNELCAKFNDNCKQYEDSYCRGILFEATRVKDAVKVGTVIKASNEENEE